jgi:hypothetical protein
VPRNGGEEVEDVNLEARWEPAWERRSEMEVRREEVLLLFCEGVEEPSAGVDELYAAGISRPAQP